MGRPHAFEVATVPLTWRVIARLHHDRAEEGVAAGNQSLER
jgi:hypothetical protein